MNHEMQRKDLSRSEDNSQVQTQELVLDCVRFPGDSSLYRVLIRGGIVSDISTGKAGLSSDQNVVDCDGRYIIPGLWDEHVHMTQWAMHANRIDLSHVTSAREAAAVVERHLGEPSPQGIGAHLGMTAVGVGFRDALWADVPTRSLLDEATKDQPVALINHDLHSVWVNTAAARRYSIEVDESGILREEPAFALTRELGQMPDSVIDRWVEKAAHAAAAKGVVGVVDFEMTWNRDPWLRRIDGGFNSLRVEAGVYPPDLERAVNEGMYTGQEVEGGHGLLHVGPLKVLIDGSLNTRTAYCIDPYPFGGHGLLTVTASELIALLEKAGATNFVPAVHAIGDAANQIALDAFERAGVSGRIEHAQFVRREDLVRFDLLGVVASVQPVHALDDRDAAESNWIGRTDRAFPLRSLLDAGASLALGSDAPVAPLDPWAAMSAATTRSAFDERGPWHPEETITREQALLSSTRGLGILHKGDPGDAVLLDADPLSVSDAIFKAMPVAATLVAGRFTYDSARLGVGSFDKQSV